MSCFSFSRRPFFVSFHLIDAADVLILLQMHMPQTIRRPYCCVDRIDDVVSVQASSRTICCVAVHVWLHEHILSETRIMPLHRVSVHVFSHGE